MNVYDFYVSPEEYAAAAVMGIDGKTLDRRIRDLGWSKQRAISTLIRPLSKERSKWRILAAQNGISFRAFHSRISLGWSDEVAATKPLQTPEEIRQHALRATAKVRKLPVWVVDLAASNGIQRETLRRRIKHGEPLEQAATRPVMSHAECGRRGAAALRAREGDWAAQIFGRR